MTDAILSQVYRAVPNIPMAVVSQGAEALVLSTSTHPYCAKSGTFIVKFRPRKPYRHPKIDALITRTRTVGEAKFMAKLNRLGVPAPALVSVDAPNGVIWMESVGQPLADGAVPSLKNYFWHLERSGACVGAAAETVCRKTGAVIGLLHHHDMVHGDLTTSNIMLDRGEACLIDFGLSSYSSLPEDKAVDLYVLERAVLSTHSEYAAQYTEWMLQGYRTSVSGNKYTDTMKKLEDVRLRGRKRSMLG